MIFGPYKDEFTPLSDRLAAYYRQIVATHANDAVVGTCLVCRVSRCEDWRSAVERLICGGEPPTVPVAAE